MMNTSVAPNLSRDRENDRKRAREREMCDNKRRTKRAKQSCVGLQEGWRNERTREREEVELRWKERAEESGEIIYYPGKQAALVGGTRTKERTTEEAEERRTQRTT